MKGGYAGRRMTIYGAVMPGAVSIANWASKVQPLTEEAKKKLKILDWYRGHGRNISLTARRFGLTRKSVRIWRNRFDRLGPVGLNELSRRPKNIRRPITSWQIVSETVKLRQQYPAWSKHKLNVLLKRKGLEVSESTIGRILKRKGLIDKKVSQKRKWAALRPKARFPRGFKISSPGDMVQVDTKHINLIGGRKIYQFTAIDVLSKKRVLEYHLSLSSKNGADFLKSCVENFPFKVMALQTDNGSEFLKDFDKLCKRLNIPHYWIYPRTPKQNAYVEISHQADDREFYNQSNICSDISVMNGRLKEHEHTWNEIRPHEALNQLTPNEYLLKWQQGRLPTKDTIILQA